MSSVTDKRFLKLLRLLQLPKASPPPRKQVRTKRAPPPRFDDGFETEGKKPLAVEEPRTAPQHLPDVIEYREGDAPAVPPPPPDDLD